MADGFADGRAAFSRALANALRPPSSLPLSEYSEKYRFVPSGPHAGPWRNDLTPYLVKPMDCLSLSHPARKMTLCGCAQIGKSEIIINWALYLSEVDPSPMLIALQSTDAANKFSDDKFTPSIRASKQAQKFYIQDAEKSSKASTTRTKRLRSGRNQSIISVLSSKNLQSVSIKYIAGDELGEWPLDVEGRGDPLAQLETRQMAYEEVGAKTAQISTPGIAGACLITREFDAGDQQYPYVRCPHCETFGRLEFEHMRGPEGETGAHFIQQCCGGVIEHRHKLGMLKNVIWLPCFLSEAPDNPAPPEYGIEEADMSRWIDRDTEGREPSFRVWQAYSKLVSWGVIWRKWLEAEGNPLRLKAFWQQVLARPFEQSRDVPEVEKLMALRREYTPGRVPVGAYLLTAGVDVQADRLEYGVYGWGPGGSGYLIEAGVIPGDPEFPGVWSELSRRVVLREFEGPSGQRVRVKATAVDSGYKTSAVYRFCSNHPHVFAIDGRDGWNIPALGTATRPKGAPCLLYPVGTWGLKSLLYSLLKFTLAGSDTHGLWQPGAQHFHQQCDAKFFEQLTAEAVVEETDKRGRTSLKWWCGDHTRNEQMDIWVYARAMAEGMPGGGLSSWSYPGPMWEQIIAEFGAVSEKGQLDLSRHWSPVGDVEHVKSQTETAHKPGRIVLKKRGE